MNTNPCLPTEHKVEIRVQNDPDKPPVTAVCSLCGMTMEEATDQMAAFLEVHDTFMARMGTGVPANRVRPRERQAPVSSLTDEEIDEDKKLAAAIYAGTATYDDPKGIPDNHGAGPDNGIEDHRLHTDGLSSPIPDEETINRMARKLGDSSNVLPPVFD